MLVDFGLASVTRDKIKSQSGATARYAPPFLVMKFHDAAWRDRYALGLILLECLGAKLPETRNPKWQDVFVIPQDLKGMIDQLPKSAAREVAIKLISQKSRSLDPASSTSRSQPQPQERSAAPFCRAAAHTVRLPSCRARGSTSNSLAPIQPDRSIWATPDGRRSAMHWGASSQPLAPT